MASARSVAVVGSHCSAPSSYSSSCCVAAASSHCSPNAFALPQQPISILSVALPPSLSGRDVLARANSKINGDARKFRMLPVHRNSTGRLDSRSGLSRTIVWNDQAGNGTQLSRGAGWVSRSSSTKDPLTTEGEEVYFDGGVHYGDLITNLIFGLTLVWLPLTLAAIFRNLFLRYRFTDKRITIQSGLIGGDRKEFPYDVVTDVKVVPRFIGEWGDMALELKDGTKVDVRAVPKFREIAKYVEEKAASAREKGTSVLSPSGRGGSSRKGFS